jgi:hypothetical protein
MTTNPTPTAHSRSLELLGPTFAEMLKNAHWRGPQDIQGTDQNGRTLLMHLFWLDRSSDKGWVRVLLDAGANPNEMDFSGQTLLWHCRNLVPFLPLFLEYGADLGHKNKKGHTILNTLIRFQEEGDLDLLGLEEMAALFDAGLWPDPETDWGMDFRQMLHDIPDAGLEPLRQHLDIMDVQRRLAGLPEGAPVQNKGPGQRL